VPLAITNVTVTGPNPGDFKAISSCGGQVSAAGNCAVSVTFAPTAANHRIATLQISAVASPNLIKIGLAGLGQ